MRFAAIVMLAASISGWSQSSSSGAAVTKGPCSPAVTGNGNTINIIGPCDSAPGRVITKTHTASEENKLLDISFIAEPGYPYFLKPGEKIDIDTILKNYSFYILSISNKTGRDATLIDFLIQLPFPISNYEVLTTKFSEGLSFQPNITTMYPTPGSTVSTNGRPASNVAQLSITRIRPGGQVSIRIGLYQKPSLPVAVGPYDTFIVGSETIGASNKKEIYAPFSTDSNQTVLLGGWSERPKQLRFSFMSIFIIPPSDREETLRPAP